MIFTTTTLSNILILSSIFILVALGLSFILNMMGILNLSHGTIYTVGGFLTYEFAVALGLNLWLALIVTAVILGALGIFLEKFCFRPFMTNFNSAVVICVAVATILQTAVNVMVGTRITKVPSFATGEANLGFMTLTNERILTFGLGIVLVIIILLFVKRAKWGLQMQAIAQNLEAAKLQGINVHTVSAIASFIGCAVASIAGALMGAFMSLQPYMGDNMMIKALVVVILAGLGSVGGIIYSGIILGILFGILPQVLDPQPAEAVALGLIIVILFFRPQGFFGHEATM